MSESVDLIRNANVFAKASRLFEREDEESFKDSQKMVELFANKIPYLRRFNSILIPKGTRARAHTHTHTHTHTRIKSLQTALFNFMSIYRCIKSCVVKRNIFSRFSRCV